MEGSGSYQEISFGTEVVAEYYMSPIVFTQITTQSQPKSYNTRVRMVTNLGFEVTMNAELTNEVTEMEEISWVSWGGSENPAMNWFTALSG